MKRFIVALVLVVQCLYAASTTPETIELFAQPIEPSGTAEQLGGSTEESPIAFPARLVHPMAEFGEISLRIRDKLRPCELCHSPAMVQRNGYLPILQGQRREYLYSKISSFKTRAHSRHPFPLYSQQLSEDEIVDIALYYALQSSSLSLGLLRIGPGWREESDAIENSISVCLECHGSDGNGAGLIPALSGQNARYLSYRMRELSVGGSRVHVYSEAPVSCMVRALGVRQSNRMAVSFALVLDESRLERGRSTYDRWCRSCHDDDASYAPGLDASFDWQTRLRAGLDGYARDLVDRSLLVHQRQIGDRLSADQWEDVLHYLLGRVSVSK